MRICFLTIAMPVLFLEDVLSLNLMATAPGVLFRRKKTNMTPLGIVAVQQPGNRLHTAPANIVGLSSPSGFSDRSCLAWLSLWS
jgi:hypothetical protein